MEFFTHKMDLELLIRQEPVLVLQFGSGSCGPCHAIRQKLDDWAGNRPGVRCLYVPMETFPRLAAQRGIFSVPTILVYVRGKLTVRESGCFSLEAILRKIENFYDIIIR